MTFMWTLAFVNTVLDDLKGLQLAVRSGKCGFCFVSRNVSSVVETVNAVGLSDAGSGTLNDRWALFPSNKKLGSIFCRRPLSVRLFWIFESLSVPLWLTGERLEQPKHYTISGERRGHEGQLRVYKNMTATVCVHIYVNTRIDWCCLGKGRWTVFLGKTTSIAQNTTSTVLCFCQIRQEDGRDLQTS